MPVILRPAACAVAAALLLAGVAPAASARPAPQRVPVEPIEISFTEVAEDFCGGGFDVLVEGTGAGRLVVVQRGDGFGYVGERSKTVVTFTTLDAAGQPVPGRTAREVNTLVFQDLSITRNEDGSLTVDVLGTGNSVWYGSDGKAVGRNPGQVRFSVRIDDGGTPLDLSDDVFLEFLGQYFGSTGVNDDFCEVLLPELTP